MCIMGYQEACIEVIIDHIIQKEGWKEFAILFLISEIPDKNWVQMFIISDLVFAVIRCFFFHNSFRGWVENIQPENVLERKISL